MGFSRDGMMLNSSCMVGWINPEGHSRIKQYYVEGFTPSEIKPEKGELPLTSVPPYIALQGASIYLAFQLKFGTHLKRQPILLAYSSRYPQHHHLTIHDDKTTIYLDFSSGLSLKHIVFFFFVFSTFYKIRYLHIYIYDTSMSHFMSECATYRFGMLGTPRPLT